MSEILDTFTILLETERTVAYLTRLDPAIIVDVIARMDELTEQIRDNPHGMDEVYSLDDMRETLARFRREKITASVGFERPSNMLPQEAAYYDALQAATNELMQVWGVE